MSRKLVILSCLLVAALCTFLSYDFRPVHAGKPVSPVLVELFTSEGCSSCPPADRILREMQGGAVPEGVQVFLMGEHVDYWDGLGWKDRFSSPDFTARQSRYARNLRIESPYTPQAVVDGQFELVGNDESSLRQAIVAAASKTKPAVIQLSWSTPETLHVTVAGAPESHVQLAVTEDGLTTDVRGGENGGHQLQHAAVVRNLRDLGKTKESNFEGEFPMRLNEGWNRQKLHIIVLAQQQNGKIVGVSAINP